jgi:hypothetical protein
MIAATPSARAGSGSPISQTAPSDAQSWEKASKSCSFTAARGLDELSGVAAEAEVVDGEKDVGVVRVDLVDAGRNAARVPDTGQFCGSLLRRGRRLALTHDCAFAAAKLA